MVFLINWQTRAASVELSLPLDKASRLIREITNGQQVAANGSKVQIRTEVPAQGLKVYRIDY